MENVQMSIQILYYSSLALKRSPRDYGILRFSQKFTKLMITPCK